MEAEATLYAQYIPEGLLADSSNKSSRNNKGAATKHCCPNKFLTLTVETQNRVTVLTGAGKEERVLTQRFLKNRAHNVQSEPELFSNVFRKVIK